MVKHIRRGLFENFQCHVHATTEIRHQRLNLYRRNTLTGLTDAIGKMLGATITQIVTVHRSDHHIAKSHIGNRFGQLTRLFRCQCVGATMGHITKWATTGTDIAHDHESRCAMTKTFTQIGATGLFTDRRQLVLAQLVLDPLNFSIGAHANPQPVRLALHLLFLGRDHLDRDTSNLFSATQFDALLDSTAVFFGGFSHSDSVFQYWCAGDLIIPQFFNQVIY